MKIPPLLFLDIDGVLNSHAWWERRKALGIKEVRGIADLDPEACQRVQRVCDTTGARLVISSTWRVMHSRQSLRRMFVKRGLTTPIIGITPRIWMRADELPGYEHNKCGRGVEIQWWLQTYLTPEQICQARVGILDDDRDMGDLLGVLVNTRHEIGLTDLEVPYIEKNLGTILMGSRACGGPGRVEFTFDALALPTYGNHKPHGPSSWSRVR